MKHLNEDLDARRWAREFNEVMAKEECCKLDEGLLVGWFANAIMCGFDEAKRRALPEAATNRNDIIEECAKVCDQRAEEGDQEAAMFSDGGPEANIRYWTHYADTTRALAEAIRALKSPTDSGTNDG